MSNPSFGPERGDQSFEFSSDTRQMARELEVRQREASEDLIELFETMAMEQGLIDPIDEAPAMHSQLQDLVKQIDEGLRTSSAAENDTTLETELLAVRKNPENGSPVLLLQLKQVSKADHLLDKIALPLYTTHKYAYLENIPSWATFEKLPVETFERPSSAGFLAMLNANNPGFIGLEPLMSEQIFQQSLQHARQQGLAAGKSFIHNPFFSIRSRHPVSIITEIMIDAVVDILPPPNGFATRRGLAIPQGLEVIGINGVDVGKNGEGCKIRLFASDSSSPAEALNMKQITVEMDIVRSDYGRLEADIKTASVGAFRGS